MEEKCKQTADTISRLRDLQENHLASFTTDRLPDLEKQSDERNIVVAQLMETVNELVSMSENKHDMATENLLQNINQQITDLLEQNKALALKVTAFKTDIKTKMGQVSKGKKTISSYRSSTAISNRPKVISISN